MFIVPSNFVDSAIFEDVTETDLIAGISCKDSANNDCYLILRNITGDGSFLR